MFFFYSLPPADDAYCLFNWARKNTKLFFYPPRKSSLPKTFDHVKEPYEFTRSHRYADNFVPPSRDEIHAKDEACVGSGDVIDADYDVPGADLEAAFGLLAESMANSPILAILGKYYNGDKEKIGKHIKVKCPMCEVGVPKTLVSIKPDQPPMKLAHDRSEGIEPTRQSKYFRKEWQRTYANPIGEEIVLDQVEEGDVQFKEVVNWLNDHPPPGTTNVIPTNINPPITAYAGNPEFQDLRWDKEMDALRDRTVKVDIPYLLKAEEEIRVLEDMADPEPIIIDKK